jgi:exopolysaccharide biosynthesis protein
VGVVRVQWRLIAEGAELTHGRTAEPPLEFWALRVELDSPALRIVVKDGVSGEGGETLSAWVSTFVSDNSLLAGINATPFDISSAKQGQPIKNMGIVVSGGKQMAPPNPRYDALVFYRDGKAAIVKQSEITSIENIENAVGAFHHILVDGEPAERTIDREGRHARSAAGISQDGKYLYLAVIDGRRARSVGGTESETSLLMRALGCWNVLNLDGGGSSALALRGSDGKVKVLNTPVHGGIPGRQRAVAACLGVSSELNLSTEKQSF